MSWSHDVNFFEQHQGISWQRVDHRVKDVCLSPFFLQHLRPLGGQPASAAELPSAVPLAT